MADDPNVIPRSAVLSSITAEANGFYGVVVTVACTFLGGSLLFLDKFAPARTESSILVMLFGWLFLVASIGCVARVRFMNLRSGKLALRGEYEQAEVIDRHTDSLSNWSQWFLIGGMLALVFMGLLNFSQITKRERTEQMNNQSGGLERLDKSIPYGSLKPNTPPPVQQAPTQNVPVNPPLPTDLNK